MGKILAICGPKKSGKTTLICQLIRDLADRGIRVSAAKHSSHAHVLDQPGTDTHAFREAGATAAALLARSGYTIFGGECEPAALLSEVLLPRVDLVLVEGYGSGAIPKLVLRPSWDPSYADALDPKTVLGIIDEPGAEIPARLATVELRFFPDRPDELVDWLLKSYLA